ncbi:hypothetical protein RFI_12067 [Reticulomyxa filosa]|uniref:Procollagen-proline 4-dioxygenase n=1 Tax=Reticulomyxa filosa TaxID=46433 RepID=X6NI96_RETFI|nr:hypothetical protein RFI_12067 [Reticulomyxa filosa]|eukprot:ETO25077.1 hypothetical protein RFI_12067 [Reticulomyxa filosa]
MFNKNHNSKEEIFKSKKDNCSISFLFFLKVFKKMTFGRFFYIIITLLFCVWSVCVTSNSENVVETKKDGETCDVKDDSTNPTVTTTTEQKDKCRNLHKDCAFWASEGECDNNPDYMKYRCAKACNTCELQTDEIRFESCDDDLVDDCPLLASKGDCDKNTHWMRLNCQKSCNFCFYEDRCRIHLKRTPGVSLEPMNLYGHVFDSIMSNETLGFFFKKNADKAKKKKKGSGSRRKKKNYKRIECVYKYGIEYITRNPPILSFDRFLSEELVDNFLNKPFHHFERSADAGELLDNFTYAQIYSIYITYTLYVINNDNNNKSSQSWCEKDCDKDDATDKILSQMEEIVRIPRENFEQLQVLQYEVGQYYNTHHDFIDGLYVVHGSLLFFVLFVDFTLFSSNDDGCQSNMMKQINTNEVQWDMICGPRILTFFIYLNDVEEGGETAFPHLSLSVKPKKGKAILWPNVPSHDYFVRDDDTHHAAQPVLKGVKYGTNAWIHLYEFRDAWERGCTG